MNILIIPKNCKPKLDLWKIIPILHVTHDMRQVNHPLSLNILILKLLELSLFLYPIFYNAILIINCKSKYSLL